MKRVLILNATYEPFDIVSWKTAMKKLHSDKDTVYVVEWYDWTISDTMGREYEVPAVMVLKDYVETAHKMAPYSKANVYARDKYRCQYCGNRFKRRELTVDHVIPRSRWEELGDGKTPTTFDNIVTACRPCNYKKGDKTIKEANMKLLTRPRRVTRSQVFTSKLAFCDVPEEWFTYVESFVNE